MRQADDDAEAVSPARANHLAARVQARERGQTERPLSLWQVRSLDAYIWSEMYGPEVRPRSYRNPLDWRVFDWCLP